MSLEEDEYPRGRVECRESRPFVAAEQLGLLARRGVVDLQGVLDALSPQPFAGWNTFEPIRAHIMKEAGRAFPALAGNQPGLDAGLLAELQVASRLATCARLRDQIGRL